MTSRNDQLWELILDHPMPVDAMDRDFPEQLMREHRIKRETALTAIEEYRKFIYLCITRSDRNVPSKAVDLVWHQHMQHSRDYWDVFCEKLGKPVHHTPGGEGRGHLDDYKATIAAYRDRFGTPPKGVWREQSRASDTAALMFVVLFIALGLTMFAGNEVPLLALLGFIAAPALAIFYIIFGMTSKGEYYLTFEIGDPFADDDAGDCGSGDGGGCGD